MEVIKNWTAAEDSLVKIRSLLTHAERVRKLSLVALSDEQAAARRKWQELISPGATPSVRRQLERKGNVDCWRSKAAENSQRVLTLQSLMRGLVKARREVEVARMEARLRLPLR